MAGVEEPSEAVDAYPRHVVKGLYLRIDTSRVLFDAAKGVYDAASKHLVQRAHLQGDLTVLPAGEEESQLRRPGILFGAENERQAPG